MHDSEDCHGIICELVENPVRGHDQLAKVGFGKLGESPSEFGVITKLIDAMHNSLSEGTRG